MADDLTHNPLVVAVRAYVKRDSMGRDGSHDFFHTERVMRLALDIGQKEGVNDLVVVAVGRCWTKLCCLTIQPHFCMMSLIASILRMTQRLRQRRSMNARRFLLRTEWIRLASNVCLKSLRE